MISDGSRLASLSEVLSTLADGKGLTGTDLRACLSQWDGSAIDAYLTGKRRPEWEFVSAFLDAVAADDERRHETLERNVRYIWNAAPIS